MGKHDMHENSKVCSEELAKIHLDSFSESFIKKEHREQWIKKLTKNRKKAFKDSSKIENHLIHKNCTLIKLKEFTDTLPKKYDDGVYFDFMFDPIIASTSEILVLSHYSDGIFSIQPGKHVYYFSHEGRIWLCKKPS